MLPIHERLNLHPIQVLIDAYLAFYPDDEYGVAHIVLSDYNLDDHALEGIITKAESELEYNSPLLLFLNLLMQIPEDKRCVLED